MLSTKDTKIEALKKYHSIFYDVIKDTRIEYRLSFYNAAKGTDFMAPRFITLLFAMLP